MRYHVQGVGESIHFEILAGMREPRRGGERQASLCAERIREAARAIEEEPWAWALGTCRPLAAGQGRRGRGDRGDHALL
jgi:hypothetical protein